jgi:N-methylhydantoinase B
MSATEPRLDPITFEVLANAFSAIVDDMGVMLEKVSFSTVTHLGKDYSCVLATPQGDVFARGAGGLCLITGTAGPRIKAVLAQIPADDLHDEDVFLINDPFMGGTHAQDVGAVKPVFADGELVCFVMAASHWPDVGGPIAGSFNSGANSTHAESLLIPPVHIVREGEIDAEMERFIFRNTRIEPILKGDLRGMIEACRVGQTQYLKLHDKHGGELMRAQQQQLMDHSERLLRQAVADLPDGTWSFTDWIDQDPASGSDDPIPVGLDLTIEGDTVIADFSRTGAQCVGPTNATIHATRATVMTALKEIFHEIPWNDGFESVVDLRVPPGTCVSAQWPRPVSGVAASPAEKVLACIHGVMIEIVPERAMACPTNLVNLAITGLDTRPGREGEEFVVYIWLAGGWGGRPGARDAHTHLIPLGPGTNLQPAETLERIFPIRFDAMELKPDSEGAGRHRGGFALRAPFRAFADRATVNVQGDRQKLNGWGAEGGLAGEGNDLVYDPEGEARRIKIMSVDNPVADGALVHLQQAGGGGWGEPATRDPQWVLDDFQAGLVSRERAEAVYGVALTEAADVLDVTVDAAATARLRGV